jgi:hypothetical protein
MSFKKNKYAVIRKAIPTDLAFFLANYFSLKKRVYDTCKVNISLILKESLDIMKIQ